MAVSCGYLISILFSSYASVLKRGYVKELKATVLHTAEVALGVLVILYLLQDAVHLSRMVFVGFLDFLYSCKLPLQNSVEAICAEESQRKRNPFLCDRDFL